MRRPRKPAVSLIAVVVTALGLATAMFFGSSAAYAAGTSQKTYLTFYGWNFP